MSEEYYLTQEGYEKLIKELDYLKTTRRREIAQAIAQARAFGDLKENAEYAAAKDDQAHNEKRINDLEGKLGGARIIDNEQMKSDEVLIGATVLLKDMDTDEELKYMLVSEMEANYEEGKISIVSPVGKALLNHKVGEEVDIKIPAGILKYKILQISR